VNIENSKQFGNYLIHGIDEIRLPEPVSLWPSTPGWQLLGLLIAGFVVYRAYRSVQRWWRNRYRREALRRLSGLAPGAQLQSLPFLLKATALHAYPREQLASLSGEPWLSFLDAHCPGVSFRSGVGKKLLDLSYVPEARRQISPDEAGELITLSKTWIAQHV